MADVTKLGLQNVLAQKPDGHVQVSVGAAKDVPPFVRAEAGVRTGKRSGVFGYGQADVKGGWATGAGWRMEW